MTASGLEPVSSEATETPCGSNSLSTMSSAGTLAEAKTKIERMSAVTAIGCRGPQWLGRLVVPLKVSLASAAASCSTAFWRNRTSPVRASTNDL